MAERKDTPRYAGSALIRAASGVTRDVMTVVLRPDRMYTEREAAVLTEKYLRKEVD